MAERQASKRLGWWAQTCEREQGPAAPQGLRVSLTHCGCRLRARPCAAWAPGPRTARPRAAWRPRPPQGRLAALRALSIMRLPAGLAGRMQWQGAWKRDSDCFAAGGTRVAPGAEPAAAQVAQQLGHAADGLLRAALPLSQPPSPAHACGERLNVQCPCCTRFWAVHAQDLPSPGGTPHPQNPDPQIMHACAVAVQAAGTSSRP